MVSLVVLGLSAADFVGLDAEQLARAGRQDDGAIQVKILQRIYKLI